MVKVTNSSETKNKKARNVAIYIKLDLLAEDDRYPANQVLFNYDDYICN